MADRSINYVLNVQGLEKVRSLVEGFTQIAKGTADIVDVFTRMDKQTGELTRQIRFLDATGKGYTATLRAYAGGVEQVSRVQRVAADVASQWADKLARQGDASVRLSGVNQQFLKTVNDVTTAEVQRLSGIKDFETTLVSLAASQRKVAIAERERTALRNIAEENQWTQALRDQALALANLEIKLREETQVKEQRAARIQAMEATLASLARARSERERGEASRRAYQEAELSRQTQAWISSEAAKNARNMQGKAILQEYTPVVQLYNNAQQRTVSIIQRLTATLHSLTASKKQATVNTTRLAWAMKHLEQNAATASKEVTMSWQSIMRLVQVQVLHRIFAMTSRYLREATREAMKFGIAMAELQTISLQSSATVEQWTTSLRHLNTEFGSPMPQLAEAAYQGLSNQVMQSIDDMTYLRETVQLATVAVGSMEHAMAASTSIVNAFGMEGRDASHIHATLFKTIEMGRIRLEEMADSLGRVSMLSSQLGITLEEQQAAFATLTIQGVKFNVAQTLLSNVMLKLIKPSERMLDIMSDYGVASGEAAIAAYGFTGFLNILSREAQKSNDVMAEFGEQWGRLRAMTGAAGLIFNMETYHETLAEMEKGATDFDLALARIMENPAKKLSIELEKIKSMFQVEWGNMIVRWGNTLTWAFDGLDKLVTKVIIGFRNLMITLALMKFAVPMVTTAFAKYTQIVGTAAFLNKNFGTTLTTLQVRLTAAKAAVIGLGHAFMSLAPFLAVTAVMAIYDAWGAAARALEDYSQKLEQTRMLNTQVMQEILSTQVREATKVYDAQMQEVLGFVAFVRGETNKLAEEMQGQLEQTVKAMVAHFEEYKNSAVESIKAIEKAQKDHTKTIEDAEKTQAQLAREKEARDLADADLLHRATDARAQAMQIELDNPELAEELRADADLFEKTYKDRIKNVNDALKEMVNKAKEAAKELVETEKKEHKALGLDKPEVGAFVAPEFDFETLEGAQAELAKVNKYREDLERKVKTGSLKEREAARQEALEFVHNIPLQERIKLLEDLVKKYKEQADLEQQLVKFGEHRVQQDEQHAEILKVEIPLRQAEKKRKDQELELENKRKAIAEQFAEIGKLDVTDDLDKMGEALDKLKADALVPRVMNVWTDELREQFQILDATHKKYLEINKASEDLATLQKKLNEQSVQHTEELKLAANAIEQMYGAAGKSADQMSTLTAALSGQIQNAAAKQMGQLSQGDDVSEMPETKFLATMEKLTKLSQEYQALTAKPLKDESEVRRAADLQKQLNAGYNKLLQLDLVAEFDELSGRIATLTGLGDKLKPEQQTELNAALSRKLVLEEQLKSGAALRAELEAVGIDVSEFAAEVVNTDKAMTSAFEAYGKATTKVNEAAEASAKLTTQLDALKTKYGEQFTAAQNRLLQDVEEHGLRATQLRNFKDLNDTLEKVIPKIGRLGGLGAPAPEKHNLGGLVRGPSGIDRVPAMLTAGEYVWDKATTDRFFPVIRQMHMDTRTLSPVTPLTRNYGNINVTVHGADSPQLTAHAVLKEMKRELRRGTI